MVGLLTFFFALYLAAALLSGQRPKDAERHLTMLGFFCLAPTLVVQQLPLMILPLLTVFLAAYLHKAR